MELTIDQALHEGVAAHREGRLEDAERYYNAILRANPQHPDANHNMGTLALNVGKVEAALPFFKRALQLNPKIHTFWISYVKCLISLGDLVSARSAVADAQALGVEHDTLIRLLQGDDQSDPIDGTPLKAEQTALLQAFKSGDFEAVESLGVSLSERYPSHYLSFKVLGAMFQNTGRLREAVANKRKAAELAPDDPGAHYNLGNALTAVGDRTEAETVYEQAVALKPDFAKAHNNLGIVRTELQRYSDAHESFCLAVNLDATNAEFQNNLGNSLERLGKPHEAILAHSVALALKPDFASAYIDFGRSLQEVVFHSSVQDLYPAISGLLKSGYFRATDLSHNVLSLLKHDAALLKLRQTQEASMSLANLQQAINCLSKLPLLQELMRLAPLPDIEIEFSLADIRRGFLQNLPRIEPNVTSISVMSSIAIQCSINEHVYFESEEESRLVAELEVKIARDMELGRQPSIQEATCVACYRPLHRYEWSKKIKVLDQYVDLKKRLITDPSTEMLLTSKIPRFGEITDQISTEVRAQYERNPYPRWVLAARPLKSLPFNEVLEDAGLMLQPASAKNCGSPAVLVAGCGTGQQPIDTATRIKGCRVTAIDLSLASLAFAERHRRELAVDNIEFCQIDLLNVSSLKRHFDLIQCSGVLHHMESPMAGLRALNDVLKPGGVMELGLYSELARADVVAAREEISKLNVGASEAEMRTFRRFITESENPRFETLKKFTDFFSLSEFRDLLFHVQEHRFSLLQIRDLLDAFGLRFCGFKDKSLTAVFRQAHGEEADLFDLSLWHELERDIPHAFRGMYQFWCQKPG